MRRPLVLILEFVVLTVPLTWLWVAWAHEAYTSILSTLAAPLLEQVGGAVVAESPAEKRFVNYVPYLVLMLITPGLSWRRRAAGIGGGCLLIFGCHVALVVLEQWAQSNAGSDEASFSLVFPAAMFTDAFPFILWAVVAHRVLRDAFARVLDGGAGAAERGPD